MPILLEIIGAIVVIALVIFGAYFYVKRFTTFNEDHDENKRIK